MTNPIGRVPIAETIDGEICPNVFGLALLTDRTVPEIRRYWAADRGCTTHADDTGRIWISRNASEPR